MKHFWNQVVDEIRMVEPLCLQVNCTLSNELDVPSAELDVSFDSENGKELLKILKERGWKIKDLYKFLDRIELTVWKYEGMDSEEARDALKWLKKDFAFLTD